MPTSLKGLKFAVQTDFSVHRYRFCNKLNSVKFSKSFNRQVKFVEA